MPGYFNIYTKISTSTINCIGAHARGSKCTTNSDL